MYNVEFLPIANKDITDALQYISKKLDNKIAAKNLVKEIEKAINSLDEFPYSNPLYIPIRPLKTEYRKMPVKNYILFYTVTVDESKKTVTVYRFIYSSRSCNEMI